MARDTNFYYAFLVLPAEKRRAIVAVWDFCRAVDDAADEATDRVRAGDVELARWRAAAHDHPERRAGGSRAGPRLHSAGGLCVLRVHRRGSGPGIAADGKWRAIARRQAAARIPGRARAPVLRACRRHPPRPRSP